MLFDRLVVAAGIELVVIAVFFIDSLLPGMVVASVSKLRGIHSSFI